MTLAVRFSWPILWRTAFSIALLSACGHISAQEFQSQRPAVAVAEIAGSATVPSWFDRAAFRSMLESAIAGTNKLRLIERRQLTSIDGERELVASGAVRSGGVADKVSAVDYLIYGTVTQFNFEFAGAEELGKGFVPYVFEALLTGESAEKPQPFSMSVDIKVTDLKTGDVRYVKSISKKITVEKKKNQSPLALKAINDLQRTIAGDVARGLTLTIYPIRVVDISKGAVTLNYGHGILSKGQRLALYSLGAPIIDPYTREVIGTSESLVGEAVVQEIQPFTAIAKLRRGKDSSIPIGAVAREIVESDE